MTQQKASEGPSGFFLALKKLSQKKATKNQSSAKTTFLCECFLYFQGWLVSKNLPSVETFRKEGLKFPIEHKMHI